MLRGSFVGTENLTPCRGVLAIRALARSSGGILNGDEVVVVSPEEEGEGAADPCDACVGQCSEPASKPGDPVVSSAEDVLNGELESVSEGVC